MTTDTPPRHVRIAGSLVRGSSGRPRAGRRSNPERVGLALAAAALAGGAVLAFAAPAHAATLGTVDLSATSGSVSASPMFAHGVTSAPCPSTFGEEAALRVGPANTGPFANLSPIVGGGGFDTHPVTIDPNRSMQAALGSAPADGTYWVVVECFSLTAGRHPDRFVTPIRVAGGTWETIQPAANTTTVLAVAPASPQPQGTELTLSATVTPAAAAGSVAFKDSGTTLGTATVSSGTAELKTTALAAGDHALTAVFTPADAAAFAGSESAPVSFVVSQPPVDDDLTVTDENGTVLGANPALHRGQKVTVTARGFAGTEEVTVRLDGAQLDTDTAADGVVTGEFEVPDDAASGAHRLTIKGAEHEVVFDFTVVEASPPPGGLPITGTNVALIAASGLVLVAGGGGALLLTRRRRSTD